MANGRMNRVMQYVRRSVLLHDGAGLSDGQLLGWFVERRDETAFAALVRRHGPMVWGVCRRVLDHHQDAEDAFQATFLVLVRKAASVHPREMVANWLYGVARHTSLKARALAARRRARERNVTMMPEPKVGPQDLWSDLQPLLDLELSHLPDKYRVAIVLCDLEGKTRKDVAQRLGLPEGTLSARLTRGRVLLAKRLSRHGLALSGGALASALSQNSSSAAVPISVVSSTIKAASLVASGEAAAAGLSISVAALTEGVMKTMLLNKLKFATMLSLVIAASTTGGLLYYQKAGANDTPGQGQQSKEDVREAAIKVLEKYAASKQESDRELAIKALAELGLRAASAHQGRPWDSIASRLMREARSRFLKSGAPGGRSRLAANIWCEANMCCRLASTANSTFTKRRPKVAVGRSLWTSKPSRWTRKPASSRSCMAWRRPGIFISSWRIRNAIPVRLPMSISEPATMFCGRSLK